MHEEIDAANRATTGRLRRVAADLSDEDLLRPIDPPWTTAALLAHIAFWDRFVQARWIHAIEAGARLPLSIDGGAQDSINDAALPQWVLVPPRDAAAECASAASSVDDFLASLEPEIVAGVVAEGRNRLVDRSLHRGEHLRMIESAFPRVIHA
jgi:DinB superfamily